MKKHNGMRPQDIVVLLKLISLKDNEWKNIDLAYSLKISTSEIAESLNRSMIAGLLDSSKKKVHQKSLKEFLIFGLKYVFPVQPGTMVRGIATAHSAPPINQEIISGNEHYVWPYHLGDTRGQAIEPLYKTVPEIVRNDSSLYKLLVIVDIFRIGRARELKIAIKELEKIMGNG
jgi:hypothetical protein